MDLRLYHDEHVPSPLADHLRRRGYDVLTTSEALRANQRLPDEDQLAFAASEGRAIISLDRGDYVGLDIQWKAEGKQHAGIILCPNVSLPELCRRVEAHLIRYSAEQHYDLLLWC